MVQILWISSSFFIMRHCCSGERCGPWASCLNKGLLFFPSGDNFKIVEIHWRFYKIFSRTTRPISIKLGTHHPWVKGILDQMKGPSLFQGEMWTNSENTSTKLKNLFLWNHRANFNQTWQKAIFGKEDLSLF